MSFTESFRAAAFALVAVIAFSGNVQPALAADLLPKPAPNEESTPVLSAAEYLDRYAELLLLRERFGAILDSDAPDLMRRKLESFGHNPPTASEIESLRNDLTAELFYYVVNLKYLILADGAVWPDDRSVRTYRQDALSALMEISRELSSGDVLALDTGHLLRRLEAVDAWTEGVAKPVGDWFGASKRQQLVDDALGSRGSH